MSRPERRIAGVPQAAPHELVAHAAHDIAGLLRQVGIHADRLSDEALGDAGRADLAAIAAKTREAAAFVASARDLLYVEAFAGPRTTLSLKRCMRRALSAETRLDGRWTLVGDAEIEGAEVLVLMAARALTDNALRHGAPGARVRVGIGRGVLRMATSSLQRSEEADFHPLTRRGTGAGLGLGLAVVRKVLMWHGGQAGPDPQGLPGTYAIRLTFPA